MTFLLKFSIFCPFSISRIGGILWHMALNASVSSYVMLCLISWYAMIPSAFPWFLHDWPTLLHLPSKQLLTSWCNAASFWEYTKGTRGQFVKEDLDTLITTQSRISVVSQQQVDNYVCIDSRPTNHWTETETALRGNLNSIRAFKGKALKHAYG